MKRAELRQGDLWGRSRWGSYRNLESGISHARQQARMIPRVTLIAGVLVGLAGAARADPAGCRAQSINTTPPPRTSHLHSGAAPLAYQAAKEGTTVPANSGG
jgi:hypothetical protein